MDLEIEVIKEYKDGSADATIHFDSEAMELLIQMGMLGFDRIPTHKFAGRAECLV